jgi:hypothetical protein
MYRIHLKWLRRVLLEVTKVFLEHAKKTFLRKGFGEYIVHS